MARRNFVFRGTSLVVGRRWRSSGHVTRLAVRHFHGGALINARRVYTTLISPTALHRRPAPGTAPFTLVTHRFKRKIKRAAKRLAAPPRVMGGSVAEWLACWTQAQKGLGSNRSRDAVG